ncbi:phospholipase D beta 2-like protein isoform X1 [Cinnamomum micranthum f. kanehirae]|uniref:phospholipase D n=1 Tax=Cinnamomum micranthum f. kanehirae TaxID=337451 RepID=A0A3S3NU72_9MAGN|nr:phospholipase D beta 2-like protein isoform X1 [Cinnamomum micranthum f. kanehirae]
MENYGSYTSDPYAYRYPPPSPPTYSYSGSPNPPPHLYPQYPFPSQPFLPPPHPYPHHSPSPYLYPIQNPPSPSPPLYPPPQQRSFHCSSFSNHLQHQHYQWGETPRPQSHSRFNSWSPDFHCQDSAISPDKDGIVLSLSQGASPSSYPLHDVLADANLTQHGPSAPQLALNSSDSGHGLPSPNPWYNQTEVYGYPNHSFNGGYQGPTDFLPLPPSPATLPFSRVGSQRAQNQLQTVPFHPSKASLKVLLLHGSLDIWILQAMNLPNMDMFSKTLKDMFGRSFSGKLNSKVDSHIPRHHTMTSDPYVSISVSNAVVGRTYVISNSENPVWMQHFYVPVAHYAAEVLFIVKDSDVVGSQLIGTVAIPTEQIYGGEKVEGCFPILNASGKPCNPRAVLRLCILYVPIEKETMYHNGVGAGPDYFGVPGTYFPLRRGGKVTLYQDAHIPEGCLPGLELDHENGKCWQDIFNAISQAKRLIYIVGWSVYHKVRLVREANYASNCTLGDLLRAKSQEGVRVLLLVWDDPTSRKFWVLQTDGVMQTHDEETHLFFKNSSVQVLLCPRSAGKRHSWLKQQEVGAIYTHHQKTVIVDADAGHNKRKIIAFVGGLDLCDGRYDTPRHPIFRTLQTVHKDDYHNPTFTGTNLKCPREPWHDLHCKIDGPAAYDILTNFEERWLKASKPHGIKRLKKSMYDDALLRIERIPDIIGMHDISYSSENDPEAWHVQVFRSIDSNSVKGFPKDPKEGTIKNLVCGKNVLIDMSIHTAYVKAIRAAQHFIYIENQYFLGSSYNWSSYNDLGANNLIPMEIALKIANKIKANERFSAYIVIPMWPEGDPTGVPTQRILFWQNKTMQMMYQTVYKALEEAGLEKTYVPQDYLNFFCLGNREVADVSSSGHLPANSPQGLALRNRRFMIYVHSKGMIVDDEYVIVGSANINQRSLEGTRDTEIAMGAYQPQHTWARKLSSPRGQIYGYRMSLWAEHIGALEECFSYPESLDCMRRLKALGEMNWQQFAAANITEMKGHLLKYPVDVDARGKVRPLAGCETFPDVGGTIVGTFFAIQENLTI